MLNIKKLIIIVFFTKSIELHKPQLFYVLKKDEIINAIHNTKTI